MGKVISHRDSRYKRFYVNRNGYRNLTNGTDYKPMVAVLKQETRMEIARTLLYNPGITEKDIGEILDLHPSTVSWHISKLRDNGIARIEKNGKNSCCFAKDPEVLKKLLTLLS